jgi:hypothetical protein
MFVQPMRRILYPDRLPLKYRFHSGNFPARVHGPPVQSESLPLSIPDFLPILTQLPIPVLSTPPCQTFLSTRNRQPVEAGSRYENPAETNDVPSVKFALPALQSPGPDVLLKKVR